MRKTFFFIALITSFNYGVKSQNKMEESVSGELFKLDSFVEHLNVVRINELETLLSNSIHHIVLGPGGKKIRDIVAYPRKYESKNQEPFRPKQKWFMFCEKEVFPNQQATLEKVANQYLSDTNDLSKLISYVDLLITISPREYLKVILENYHPIINRRITLYTQDSIKIKYSLELGSVFYLLGPLQPEYRATSYYYNFYAANLIYPQRVAPFWVDTTKIEDWEKGITNKYFSLLLSNAYLGMALAVNNSSEFTIDNYDLLWSFRLLRNQHLFSCQSLNEYMLKNNMLGAYDFISMSNSILNMLVPQVYVGNQTNIIPSASESNLLKLFNHVGTVVANPKLYSKQEIIFLQILGRYFLFKNDYKRALEVYSTSLLLYLQNLKIPHDIENYDYTIHKIFPRIILCMSKLNIDQVKIASVYKEYEGLIDRLMFMCPTDSTTGNYQLEEGFHRIAKYYLLVAQRRYDEASRLITEFIKRIYLKIDSFYERGVTEEFLENYIEANYLLDEKQRRLFYLNTIVPSDTFVYTKIIREIFLDKKSVYNWQPYPIEQAVLFHTAQGNAILHKQTDDRQKLEDEELRHRKKESIYYLLAGAIISIILFLFFQRIYTKAKKRKNRQNQLLEEEKKRNAEEKNNLNLLHKNVAHNWLKDQSLFTNILFENEETFNGQKEEYLISFNEKFVAYFRISSQNWVKNKVTLGDALKAVSLYSEVLQVQYPGLNFYIEPAEINPNEVVFMPAAFETFLHNSLYKGFKNNQFQGTLRIKYYKHEACLICIAQDDGEPRKGVEDYFTGPEHGIELVKQRVEFLYKRLHKKIPDDCFTINILEGNKKGTSIRIKIPYEEA